jgi:hypothetical protein
MKTLILTAVLAFALGTLGGCKMYGGGEGSSTACAMCGTEGCTCAHCGGDASAACTCK